MVLGEVLLTYAQFRNVFNRKFMLKRYVWSVQMKIGSARELSRHFSVN